MLLLAPALTLDVRLEAETWKTWCSGIYMLKNETTPYVAARATRWVSIRFLKRPDLTVRLTNEDPTRFRYSLIPPSPVVIWNGARTGQDGTTNWTCWEGGEKGRDLMGAFGKLFSCLFLPINSKGCAFALCAQAGRKRPVLYPQHECIV